MNISTFEQHRPLLFSIAYRMMGSAMEAEDIVQEGWLRVRTVPTETVTYPKAYLSQVVTRLSLDRLKSAQVQREEYIGTWLPEPMLTKESTGDDTLSLAFLTLLEQLSPTERAVFLLREAFDYDYGAIATIVEKSEPACRQIFSRARTHLAEHERRFQANPQDHLNLINAFVTTMASGDLAGLEQFLAEDVTTYGDGGGKVAASRYPLHGKERVAWFLERLITKALKDSRARFTIQTVNGLPAFMLWQGEMLYGVMAFEMEAGKVIAVRNILNPDKLQYLKKQLDAHS